jgi:plastocyanin
MSLTPNHARRGAALLTLAVLGVTACSAGAASTRTAAHPAPSVAPAGTNHTPTTMPMPAGAPDSAVAAAVASNAVTIQGFKFGPNAITIKTGTTVTWTNKDDEAHTVFFAFDGSRSPILVNSNNVYSKTFSTPGSYTYHCTIHPFMTGTVTVTA